MEHSCNCRNVMETALVWALTVRAATDQQQVWAKGWQHCGMRQKKVLSHAQFWWCSFAVSFMVMSKELPKVRIIWQLLWAGGADPNTGLAVTHQACAACEFKILDLSSVEQEPKHASGGVKVVFKSLRSLFESYWKLQRIAWYMNHAQAHHSSYLFAGGFSFENWTPIHIPVHSEKSDQFGLKIAAELSWTMNTTDSGRHLGNDFWQSFAVNATCRLWSNASVHFETPPCNQMFSHSDK